MIGIILIFQLFKHSFLQIVIQDYTMSAASKMMTSNNKVEQTKSNGESIKDIHYVNFYDQNELCAFLCHAGIPGKLNASLLECQKSFLST